MDCMGPRSSDVTEGQADGSRAIFLPVMGFNFFITDLVCFHLPIVFESVSVTMVLLFGSYYIIYAFRVYQSVIHVGTN